MKRAIRYLPAALALGLLAAGGWVRLAPVDAGRWHRIPGELPPAHQRNGVLRRVAGGDGDLVRLDALVRRTPRTRAVAGSVADGMITYVTRSAMFGFPDYTTIAGRDGRIEIFARARYGVSDFGVNAARVEGWLRALGQGG